MKADARLKFARDTEGEWVNLPLAMLMQTVFFGGYKGSGKTTAMKKLFEAAHEAGAQCVSIAPLGRWWSLRVARNGKGKGLRGVVVFGGEYGDVPIVAGGGRVIARAVHEKRLHAVLDVELMRKDERATFLADFFEELMLLRKKGRHGSMVVFLDETQSVAPQKSSGREVERLRVLLGDFARECRNFGCGLVMSAQRSASVDKELIALCDMLIVMRTVHNLDRKAYKLWVDEKGDGDEDTAYAWLRKLKRLEKGEAYLYAPEQSLFERVRVEMIRTFDATATAAIGQKVARVGRPNKLDVKKLGAELSELVQQAAADDPTALRAEIKKLKNQLAVVGAQGERNAADVRLAKEAMKLSPGVIKRNMRAIEQMVKRLEKGTRVYEKLFIDFSKSVDFINANRDRMAQAQQVVVSGLDNALAALGKKPTPATLTKLNALGRAMEKDGLHDELVRRQGESRKQWKERTFHLHYGNKPAEVFNAAKLNAAAAGFSAEADAAKKRGDSRFLQLRAEPSFEVGQSIGNMQVRATGVMVERPSVKHKSTAPAQIMGRQQDMIDALAGRALTRDDLITVVGMAPGGGANNYVSALKAGGFIALNNERAYQLTPEGVKAVRQPNYSFDVKAVLSRHSNIMGKMRDMVDFVIANPNVSRDQIIEAVGMAKGGGSNNYVSALKSRGIFVQAGKGGTYSINPVLVTA